MSDGIMRSSTKHYIDCHNGNVIVLADQHGIWVHQADDSILLDAGSARAVIAALQAAAAEAEVRDE